MTKRFKTLTQKVNNYIERTGEREETLSQKLDSEQNSVVKNSVSCGYIETTNWSQLSNKHPKFYEKEAAQTQFLSGVVIFASCVIVSV